MKALIILLLVICAAVSVFAQEITRNEFRQNEWQMKTLYWHQLRERQTGSLLLDQNDFDVKYWDLRLKVTDIPGQMISGTVSMTSQSVTDGLASVDYNFHIDMVADSVKMNGTAVSFTHTSNILTITLNHAYNTGELFTTVVYYHGHPPGGGLGSFTWDTHNGQPIISTLSEPEGAREWWPCKDQPHDKADSADVYITTPTALTGTSNGALISNIDNGNGTRTFHWHISYPITTYLICVSISNYQSFTNWYVGLNGDSMPVTHYVYPELYSQAVEDLGITPQAIGVYASLFGEYPFIREKYGHSLFPWGGAMEHQCNTSYGSMLIRGDHAYDWILVHELSHQWFGDMITCDIWPDVWMNEGFASYCEALYYEHFGGFSSYISYMQNSNGVYDPSGPIYNPSELFDGNTVYNKGSWVLHMLRGVMGDSAFFHGMRSYANDPAHMYGTITTRGFQHIMEQFYGADLGWFFDEWVWGQNRPSYRYSWVSDPIGGGNYQVYLHIRQIQTAPAPDIFTMPIRVYPHIGAVDTILSVWNDSRIDDFNFVVHGNPSSLAIDKDTWILRDAQSESYRLNIITTSLPGGREDSIYSEAVRALGGTLPYHFSVTSGYLPSGLNLNPGTGLISGMPTAPAVDTFTVHCFDSSGLVQADDQILILTVLERIPLCIYIPGDVNGNGDFNGLDVTYSVSYFKGGPTPAYVCDCPLGSGNFWYVAGDVNASCSFNGVDISYMVSYLKGMGLGPTPCPDCPPGT